MSFVACSACVGAEAARARRSSAAAAAACACSLSWRAEASSPLSLCLWSLAELLPIENPGSFTHTESPGPNARLQVKDMRSAMPRLSSPSSSAAAAAVAAEEGSRTIDTALE